MTKSIHDDKILILDFGSQYTQLIARRVRELGVYCELHPHDMTPEDIRAFAPDGIILSGGPNSVTVDDTPRVQNIVFELGCPVLGICYGMQAIAAQMGGKVSTDHVREYGFAELKQLAPSPLFESIAGETDVWMSHGDHVDALPKDFIAIAKTKTAPYAAIAHVSKPYFGVQFHPEVTHSRQGKKILENFVRRICNTQALWTADNIIDDSIERIRQTVGNHQVILGLSGGVDSSVVAALLHRAIGDQLTCVFVDNGLLRLNEPEQVLATFQEHFGIRVVAVDARDEFYTALKGVSDPEAKRKKIGNLFVEVFEREAGKLTAAKFLAQGTIYPDVIESAAASSGKATLIKSHHNVGGLPEHMSLQLLEPLRELFKDEVREIGLALGLPYESVYRHPFPGPGLGVRILGEIKPEYVEILRQVDSIYVKELQQNDLYHKVAQAFAVFLPVKAVGVKGDARHYEYVVALRAVETTDFMTADWAQLPYTLLARVSQRIMNEVKGVSRVVYDISSKPPATIEWE